MNAISARALQCFDEFVELPAHERERRLAALAAADPELHAALRALLHADADEALGVLDRAPAQILAERRAPPRSRDPAPAPPDLRVGARLGAWRIDRLIARGDMGTVYEAHRDDGQYHQRVALKCVRAELDSPPLIAALREERNVLARLDHPGIAALVDGGIDADGHPWFALRYVEGEPIDAWCDRRRVGIGARVDLLLQVCDAVAYAHAQGVLHRDLKPSNVLTTADGRAQLLDFGISIPFGPLREALDERPALTAHYAAPESRTRGAQGPATDLYALGVLGYRLLSGQWPTPLHGLRPLLPNADPGPPLAMARLLDEASDQAAHARGASDAAALARQLRGDLSAIALKAVAPRPQDRYASVAEFADELRRWREGRPVRARPGSALSRARKWLRRNPLAAGLSAALIVAAGAGLGAAAWQQRQAQREALATEQVGRLFASTLGEATLSGLGSARFSSRALLERTERELRALPLADQPALHAHALATLARSYAQIGDYRHAAALADQALALSAYSDPRSGPGSGPRSDPRSDARDDDGFVAVTLLSSLNYRGRHREAMELAQARLRALGDGEDERVARLAIGIELARTQWALSDTRQAAATADRLVAQAERLGPAGQDRLAQTLILRSGFLRGLGRLRRAESDAQRALLLARPLDPLLADDALERLVDVQRVRLSPEYPESARVLVQERQRSLGPNHPQTALAEVYVAIAQYPNFPRENAVRTLRNIRAGYGRDTPVYALALSRLAFALARDRDEELAQLREAVATLRRTSPGSEMTFTVQLNLSRVLMGRDVTRPEADFDEGLDLMYRDILERERAGISPLISQFYFPLYASLRGADARLPVARRVLDEGLRAAPSLYSPGDVEWLSLRMADGILRYRMGQYALADAQFADLLRLSQSQPAASGAAGNRRTEMRAVALLYRGANAFRTCRTEQALTWIAQSAEESASRPRGILSGIRDESRTFLAAARRGRLPARPPLVRPLDAPREAPELRACRPSATRTGAPRSSAG